MGKNARKRAGRLVNLATAQPEQFERVWQRRLQSKLYELHTVAGDLGVVSGAFDIVDQELVLLRQATGDRQVLRDAKSILEYEAIRALRLNC